MLHEHIIIQAQAAVQDQHLTLDQDTHQDDNTHLPQGMETCICDGYLSIANYMFVLYIVYPFKYYSLIIC